MIGPDYVIICLYVDEILIFSTKLSIVNEAKRLLSSLFKMKDLEEADVILGINLRKTNTGFSWCQSHYIEKVLKRFNSFDVVLMRTPFGLSIHLKKNRGSSVSQIEYAKIIGSMLFLMNYTHPDIAYAVSRLSRYTHNPTKEHWDALHCLLRYLKGTMDWCSHFM